MPKVENNPNSKNKQPIKVNIAGSCTVGQPVKIKNNKNGQKKDQKGNNNGQQLG